MSPRKRSRNPYEPWLHRPSGYWCKKIGGIRHYLSRDYQTAKLKLRCMRDGNSDSLTRDWLEAPFASLADEYLEDVKTRRASGTYCPNTGQSQTKESAVESRSCVKT